MRWIRPDAKWLYAIVTCMTTSNVSSGWAPSKITCTQSTSNVSFLFMWWCAKWKGRQYPDWYKAIKISEIYRSGSGGYHVMLCEVVVGDSDVSGSFYGTNQQVSTIGKVQMVQPNLWGIEDVESTSIWLTSLPKMVRRTPNHCRACGHTIINVDTMNNHILNVLYSDACTSSNVNIVATTINCLVAHHDEFLLKLDFHVTLKDNPERLSLKDSPAQCTISRVNSIIITVISDNIDLAFFPTCCILAKPNCTISQCLTVLLPVWITSPAIINRIPCVTPLL